jgi:cytochrome P450
MTARAFDDLPGPPGLPLLGNLHQVRPHRFHQQLEAWHRTYGDAFRLRLGGRRFLAVADPTAIAAALRDRPFGLVRTDRLVANAEEMGFDGIISVSGQAWQRQRPMVMAAFAPGQIRNYFPTLVRVTHRLAARWQRAAAQRHDIPLSSDLMRYTVDVIAGLSFGADINTLEQEDIGLQRHLNAVAPALTRRLAAPFPYWHWLRLPADRQLDRDLAAVHAAVRGFIAEARARLQAEPARRAAPANLIEAMLVARDDPASGLSDRDVAGNALTLLLGGQDTSAQTLSWLIYLLSRHPAALARATAEARAVCGAGRVPERFEQTEGLDYIEACCHEAMRLKPAGPLNVAKASQDTVVAGVRVPAGCGLIFSIRPGATDARHFPEPQIFDPTRWLSAAAGGASGIDAASGRADGVDAASSRADGVDAASSRADGVDAASSRGSAAKRFSMPFGAGPRMCPGRYLALLEIKMVMAMLLSGFDIEAVTTPGGGEAAEHLAMSMSPVGLKMRLRERT